MLLDLGKVSKEKDLLKKQGLLIFLREGVSKKTGEKYYLGTFSLFGKNTFDSFLSEETFNRLGACYFEEGAKFCKVDMYFDVKVSNNGGLHCSLFDAIISDEVAN